MIRYYIEFNYVYDPVNDSEYYKYSAENIINSLMRYKNKWCEHDGCDHGKICISANEELTTQELKDIIKYLWESAYKEWTGSYNGFEYKKLESRSFKVKIERVKEKDICQTTIDVCKISNKIIECFAEQDGRNIFEIYDSWKSNIEKEIKTIEDCL